MNAVTTDLPGVVVLEPARHGDDRGWFCETWNQRTWADLGLQRNWVQDNHSRSGDGVLRGLHFQRGAQAQDKLVRVVVGAAFDVVVDLRRDSPTFGRWCGVQLDADSGRQIFIPAGCAHGFLSLREGTELLYKCSAFYDPASERGLAWDDPHVGIVWPRPPHTISARDRSWPRLHAIPVEDLA